MIRRFFPVLIAFLALLSGLRSSFGDGLIVVRHPPVVVAGHFSFAPLEVTYHKVTCDINDQVATTKVDQEFFNPNNARLEGDYIFPVPVNATIDHFTMDIDGKEVTAELLPAEKARGIYEEIVREARDPALLEYAGRAMFRVRIFPIEPNSKKRIQLSYTELLKQDNGLLDYHYTLNTEKYSSRLIPEVSISVNITSSVPLTTLYSPTHSVDIKRKNDSSAVVSYEGRNVRPDTDFHLFVGRKQTAMGVTVLSYRPDPERAGYFVLLASPTLKEGGQTMPKDVVFVIDTSGSMGGKKIEQARNALKYCVGTLNAGDRFDVLRFSTDTELLFGALMEATEENRKKGKKFAAGLRASGGTAIDEALHTAIAERPGKSERMFLVVFMTDGQPTVGEENPEVIVQHVKEQSGSEPVRIFSFGVGTDVNTKLLDLVAEQTRGYSQYVLPNENLEVSMSNFWGKVQDPVIASLKMETGGVAVSKLYPKALPDLFKGDQLVAFGTYEKAGATAVSITGTVNGEVQTFTQEVTFAEKTEEGNDWIAKLWATRRVGYLLDEIRLHGENGEVKGEIVELARRWGVVTPYTAMLIIEDEKHRGVPVAEQSLRQMSSDSAAVAAAGMGMESLRRGSATGGQAVKDSLNTNEYKAAGNLNEVEVAAAQMETRDQFGGGGGGGGGFGGGSAMAKRASARSSRCAECGDEFRDDDGEWVAGSDGFGEGTAGVSGGGELCAADAGDWGSVVLFEWESVDGFGGAEYAEDGACEGGVWVGGVFCVVGGASGGGEVFVTGE